LIKPKQIEISGITVGSPKVLLGYLLLVKNEYRVQPHHRHPVYSPYVFVFFNVTGKELAGSMG